MTVATLLLSVCATLAPFQIVDRPGFYTTAGSSECIRLFYGEAEATYLQVTRGLHAERRDVPRGTDATAFAWLDSDRLVFSSSPIYGEGGLWLYNVRTKRIDEIGPVDEPSALEYLWTKLLSVDSESVTCWVADVNRLDLGDLEQTAERRSFHWAVRPRPLRANN